jgi:hypothetical protein
MLSSEGRQRRIYLKKTPKTIKEKKKKAIHSSRLDLCTTKTLAYFSRLGLHANRYTTDSSKARLIYN